MYGKTRKEVAAKLATALRAQNAGVPLPDDRITVKQFMEQWLEQSAKPSVRPWTYRGYEVHVRLHIVPALANVRLTRLTPHEVQQWTNERLAAGFAPKTVHYMKGTLQTALNQAMKWGLVMRNVAALVDPPRGTSTHTVKPLTVDEAKTLLRTIRGDRLEALYVIALTTGLRQAEIPGLTWDAVDLDTGTLHVDRSLQRIGGRYQLVDVKTRLSRREVSMPASVRERVREHRRRQLEERLNLGPRWHNDLDLVFTTDRGRPLHGTSSRTCFKLAWRRPACVGFAFTICGTPATCSARRSVCPRAW